LSKTIDKAFAQHYYEQYQWYTGDVISFFYGENTFAMEQEIGTLQRAFTQKHTVDAVAKYDASDSDPEYIFAELVNVTLFSPQRFFVIKNVFSSKVFVEKLGDFLPRIPSEYVVILSDVKPDKRTKLFKTLRAHAEMKEFKILREWEVKKWLSDEVRRRSIAMDVAAQEELLRAVSGEENVQQRLAQELDKFSLLHGTIDAQNVREIVEANPATNAFDIFALAMRGDRAGVVREIKNLRHNGEDANRFFGLLASQVFALTGAVYGGSDAATLLKVHPFQLSNMHELAHAIGDMSAQKKFTQKLTRQLAETDAKIKLSRADEAWEVITAMLATLRVEK
jgi:DNA polymerase-3 subunit delta